MASASTTRVVDSIPPLKDNGFKGLMGASDEGFTLQAKQITATGSPFAVDLEAQGLSRMADTSYVVVVQGETVARVTVDQSTITVNGFSVLGAANGEVLHLLICGRIKGQKA